MERATYARMAEIQSEHWWYEGRRAIISSVISALNLPKDAAILEAGCGPGANLAMLAAHGRVSAFEPDGFSRAHAAAATGIAVLEGYLPEPVPFSEPFDLVGAFDVIEHVADDAGSLRALHGLTKPGGYTLFTVPAWMFLWSAHDVANHHHRRYTRPAFAKLLREAGYEIVFISYINMLLFPAVAAVRFLKNLLKVKDSPDDRMPRLKVVNTLLYHLFAAERYLLRVCPLPFGVSIIALCRRPGPGTPPAPRSLGRQLIAFCGVGILNTAFGLAVILLLGALGFHYILANALGYAAGLALSFGLHRHVTFSTGVPAAGARVQFGRFTAVFAVCYLLQLGLLHLLIGAGWPAAVAQTLAVGLYTVLSFAGNRYFTFTDRKAAGS